MVDLILFGISAGVVLVLVAVFLVGLYLSKDDTEDGNYYFKYSYLFHCASHKGAIVKGDTCYVKCNRKSLRLYRTFKSCAYNAQRYDLSHVTWISRKEYDEQTK